MLILNHAAQYVEKLKATSQTPKDCTGTRGQWLKRQIDSILSRINSQQLPFVLKNQQTFDEVGTWVVSALDDLTDLKSRSLQPGSSQTIIPS